MRRSFELASWIGGSFIFLLYGASLFNSLRFLYNCATIEPGIIPKIRSKSVNYQRGYKVAYREEEETVVADGSLSQVEIYFSLNKFRLAND